MKGILLLLLLGFGLSVSSQDTLRVMHYNLLNYGNCFTGCTASNNNMEEKDEFFRTIIDYLKPDVLTVNELCEAGNYPQRILDEVLNDDGISYYLRAGGPNIAMSDIVNQVYYDSRKLVFHSHRVIQSYVRDIDLFRLYYYSNDLEQGDTVFIDFLVAHLKSGNDPDDEQKRSVMTGSVMQFLRNGGGQGNRLFMGDLNVYSGSEAAFQNLVSESDIDIRFCDPANQVGAWHNDDLYSSLHTQSTRDADPGCGASGGMDDRFDFILISNAVKEGRYSVSYIEGTYQAPGQDGQHFNLALNEGPVNTAVPAAIAEALYGLSDHLPVVLDLRIDKTLGEKEHELDHIVVVNPAGEYATVMDLPAGAKEFHYEWFDLLGRPAGSGNIFPANIVTIPAPPGKGTYFLKISSFDREIKVFRILRM